MVVSFDSPSQYLSLIWELCKIAPMRMASSLGYSRYPRRWRWQIAMAMMSAVIHFARIVAARNKFIHSSFSHSSSSSSSFHILLLLLLLFLLLLLLHIEKRKEEEKGRKKEGHIPSPVPLPCIPSNPKQREEDRMADRACAQRLQKEFRALCKVHSSFFYFTLLPFPSSDFDLRPFSPFPSFDRLTDPCFFLPPPLLLLGFESHREI